MRAPRVAAFRRWPVVATMVLAAAVAACGGDDGVPATTTTPTTPTTPTTAPASSVPTTAVPASTTTTSGPTPTTDPGDALVVPAGQTMVRIWFLRGERFEPAYRTGTTATQAVRALLAGPVAGDGDGLTTAIPAGTTLRGMTVAGGVVTVDLTGTFAAGGGSLSMAARLSQVVATVTEFPGVTGVLLALDGTRIDTLGGEGLDVSAPLGRANCEPFLPFVIVTEPLPGALVTSPVRVAGLNTTYENTVGLWVVDDTGRILADGWATGTGEIYDQAGRPVWGPFASTVAFDPRGATTGAVVGYDTSAEDGTVTTAFRVPVRFAAGSSTTTTAGPPVSALPGASTTPVSVPRVPASEDTIAFLTDVRTARHPGFERVVFEFENRLPGYAVGYASRPVTEDPSDLPLYLLGDRVLVVRMEAAAGFDGTEDLRITYEGPTRIRTGQPVVVELARIGDFEAVLSWAIATIGMPPFRVTTLTGPPRLVIDIAA
jgi:hypothetical protein